MSAMGGGEGGQSELIRAITTLSRDMEANSRAVRDLGRGAAAGSGGAGNGMSGGPPAARGGMGGVGLGAGAALAGPAGAALGFAENAAMKAGRDFAMDTGLGVASKGAKFGFGGNGVSFSDAVTSSALSAAEGLPIVGDAVSSVTDPLKRAAGRTAGITTAIARAGGKVDPEMRKALYQNTASEEVRAEREDEEVQKLMMSDKESLGGAMAGTSMESGLNGMQAVVDNLGAIAAALAQILANPATAPGAIAGAAVTSGVTR